MLRRLTPTPISLAGIALLADDGGFPGGGFDGRGAGHRGGGDGG